MYCAWWLASVARRECKCFSSLFVWPGPLPLMKSKYRKSRHIHCNIFHIFATFFIFLKHFPYFCNEYWRNSESFGENLLTLFFLAKNIFRFFSIMIIFPEQWVPWKWYCIVITLYCPRNQLNATYSVISFRKKKKKWWNDIYACLKRNVLWIRETERGVKDSQVNHLRPPCLLRCDYRIKTGLNFSWGHLGNLPRESGNIIRRK